MKFALIFLTLITMTSAYAEVNCYSHSSGKTYKIYQDHILVVGPNGKQVKIPATSGSIDQGNRLTARTITRYFGSKGQQIGATTETWNAFTGVLFNDSNLSCKNLALFRE